MPVWNVGNFRFNIDGNDTLRSPWREVTGNGDRINNHWTMDALPQPLPGQVGFVDMGLNNPTTLARDEDRLTLSQAGHYVLNIRGVEHLDADSTKAISVEVVGKTGFTTDGSFDSIKVNVGNHEIRYTGALEDSTLFTGTGWDQVRLIDQPDVAGTQYWAIVRRADGEVDAYSLFSGFKVQFGGGGTTWGNVNGRINYGEVDEIYLASRFGGNLLFGPGTDIPNTGDRGGFANIDLANESVDTSIDRLIAASFKSIHYATQNVHNGTAIVERFSGDTTNGIQSQSRDHIATNGNHYLLIDEEPVEIDGHLRLYVRNNNSGLYNRFNEVYLGTSSANFNSNDYSTSSLNAYATDQTSGAGATKVLGTVMYGFGGNDVLIGGSDVDYFFGGTSTFTTIPGTLPANVITGGSGGDFFGVGNIVSGQDGDNLMTTNFAARLSGTAPLATDSSGIMSRLNLSGGVVVRTADIADLATRVATDRILDWTAGVDSLRVLGNGTAIIEGLGTALGAGGDYVLDPIDGSADRIDVSGYVAAPNATAFEFGSNTDVIVTSAGHGLLTGDAVRFGAPVGLTDEQIAQNVDYTVTVLNADTFRIAATALDADPSALGRVNTVVSMTATRMVRNEGKIVARGFGGNDTLVGSTGDDWLYGNGDNNVYQLAAGGNDRVYIDVFANSTSKHIVNGFSTSSAAASNTDLIMLNKRIVDAFFAGGASRTILTQDSVGDYIRPTAYNPGRDYLHDVFYNPAIATTTSTHDNTDGAKLFAGGPSGADGTTSLIGLGMIIAGRGLLAVPIVGPIIGGALIVAGTILEIEETQEHVNARYTGNVDGYLNVITEANVAAGTLQKPVTSTSNDDRPRFLSFFGAPNNDDPDAGDGYLPVVEFTASAGRGVYGFFALHSSSETFVYLVASRDNLVEEAEAFLIAQINGQLTSADFAIYDGESDIYNFGTIQAVVLKDPEIVTVFEQGNPGNNAEDDGRITNLVNPIVINGTVATGIAATATFRLYDGATMIFEGPAGTPGGLVALSFDGSTFNFVDTRPLGTIVRNTTNNSPGTSDGDDTYVLADDRVSYTVELVDPATGIPTRDTTNPITVTGGNVTINGGAGSDILLLTETSDFVNNATDAKIIGFETIVLAGSANGNPPVATPISLDLRQQTEAFRIASGETGDTIVGGRNNDTITSGGGADSIDGFNGDDTVVYTNSYQQDANGNFLTDGGGNRIVDVTAAAQLDADAAVIGGLGFDTIEINGETQTVTISDALFDKVSQFEGLSLTGTGAQNVTLGTNTNKAFSSGITLSTIATATSLNLQGALSTVSISATATNNADTLVGGTKADTLVGGNGNDTITGGGGFDNVSGGLGDDTFVLITQDLDNGSLETISGGDGTDTLLITNDAAVFDGFTNAMTDLEVINLQGLNGQTLFLGAAAAASFNNVTVIVDPTAARLELNASNIGIDDTITATGTNNNDLMTGGSAADTLNGGNGRDTITGGAGADSLDGGAGNDVFIIAAAADHAASETIIGGADTDVIRFTSVASATLTLSSNVNVEEARITNADGISSGTTGESIDASAAQGTIALYGNDGNNQLTGNANANVINGGGGSDTIIGGGGADSMDGGAGNDVFIIAAAADHAASETIIGGADTDVIRFTSVASATLTLSSNVNVEEARITNADGISSGTTGESIDASAAQGTIALYGNDGNNQLTGNANANVINGAGGSDTIIGGGGADSIDGGDGNDTISFGSSSLENVTVIGGAGDDRIDEDGTGFGNDSLTGGTGNDSIWGGDGNDFIDGGDDNDSLNGEGGNDTIIGGDGNDSLDGGVGTDVLWGGQGQDHVTANGGSKVIVVGDLRTADAAKILTINTALTALLGYNPGLTAQNYTTSDVVAGETISFDNDAANELHLFGTVDLSGVTLSGNYNLVTYSEITLTIAQLNGAQSLTLVDNPTSASSHSLIIVDNDTRQALTADDQQAAFDNWLDQAGQQLIYDLKPASGSRTGSAPVTLGGKTYDLAPSLLPQPLSNQAGRDFTSEKIAAPPPAPNPAVVPGAPVGANPNTTTLLFDVRSSSGVAGNGDFAEAVTSGTSHFRIFPGDRFKGASFISEFVPGVTSLPVPDTFSSWGDDKVHNGQFEVYYGNYDQLTGIFQVTATPAAAATAPYTLILYDNDTARSVRFIEGLVFANYMVEAPWSIANPRTSTASLSFGGSLDTTTYRQILGSDDPQTLSGIAGRPNYIYGRGGNDSITGTSVADFISAGVGADTVIGGGGGDVIDLGDPTFDASLGDSSADLLVVNAVASTSTDSAVQAGVSEVAAGIWNSGAGTVTFTATNSNQTGADYVYNFELARDTIRVAVTGISNFSHVTGATQVAQVVNAATFSANATVAASRATLPQQTLFIDLDGGGMGAGDIAITFREWENDGGTAFTDRVQYVMTGTASADNLVGGMLSDTITGGFGADTLKGGGGNDMIIVNGTVDIAAGENYDGGDNTDTLFVTADTNFTGVTSISRIEIIEAAATVDLIFMAARLTGQTIAINGTGDNGGESLAVNGTADPETIDLSGLTLDINDISGAVINAGNGDDSVVGTNGNDTIDGSNGNDTLRGGSGNDVILGGIGADDIFGNAGNDFIDGGDGDDVINGGEGDDTIIGGDGNDFIEGGSTGDDSLVGGLGDDTLVGGAGRDTLIGGDGADVYRFAPGSTAIVNDINQMDVIDGFNVIDDTLNLSAFGALSAGPTALADNDDSDSYVVQWSSSGVTNYVYLKDTGVTGGLTLSNAGGVVTVAGSSLLGLTLRSVTSSGITTQGDGPHRAYYTQGDFAPNPRDANTFYTESVNVGMSTDYTFALANIAAVDDSVHTGLIAIRSTNNGAVTYLDARVYVGGNTATADIITADLASASRTLNYAIVYGQGGNDTITGSTGNDYLFGGADNDTITGGAGSDVLFGGSGVDTFRFDFGRENSFDVVMDFDAGNAGDVIEFVGTNDVSLLDYTTEGDFAIIAAGNDPDFPVIITNGFTAITGVTATSTALADVLSALGNSNTTTSSGLDVVYFAINVVDADPYTLGDQAGAVVVRQGGPGTPPFSVVMSLVGVDVADLTTANLANFA